MPSALNINAGKGPSDQTRFVDMLLDLSAAGENINSYPTGGFDLPAALDAEIPQGLVTRSLAVKANTTHYAAWDADNRKVVMYTDVDLTTEVTNGTDLTGVTAAPLVLLGH